jgi:DNA-binding winged helix-turn-helix (wHTH) protein/tetratricopeptide (TPR) repeat protein
VSERRLLRVAGGTIDLEAATGTGPRGPFTLSLNEAALLACLAERAGEAVSRDELQVRGLGYSPVVSTRAVDAAMSRLRQKLEPRPDTPEHLQTVYGVGYRLILDASATAPAASPAPGAVVGREGVLATLRHLTASPGHVELHGPPGVGLSTVATELARRAGAALVVRFEGGPAAEAVGRALGGAGGALGAAVRRLRHELVVFDDADRAEGTAEVVALLVQAEARVLTTTRRPGAAQSVALPGLAPADARALADAVRRARGVEPHPRVHAIVEALGGHPDAIVYFARRSVVIDPAVLARQLPEGRGAGLGEALAARTLTWAWAVLSSEERASVTQLLAFRGPFPIAGAAAVWAVSETEATDRVVALVERGVLSRKGTRFEVFPLLRLAATTASPALRTPTDRWRTWVGGEARRLAEGAPTVAVMEDTRSLTGDLRELLDHALAADPATATEVAWVLVRAGERFDPPDLVLATLDRVLAAVPPDPRLLVSRAILLFNLGRRDQGRSDIAAALAASRPDEPCRPFVETFWPVVTLAHQGWTDADTVTPVLRRAVEAGLDRWWTARAWCTLAQFLRLLDRPDEAIDACLHAAEGWAWVEDTMGEALAWEELALANLDAGRAEPARVAIERGAALRETNGPSADPPHAELRRGTVLHELGALAESRSVLTAGRRRAEIAGLPPTAYDAALGWLDVEEGAFDTALERLQDAERVWRASGHGYNTSVLAAHRCLALTASGRAAEALALVDRAPAPDEGAPFAVRLVHGLGALLAHQLGDRARAERSAAAWAPAAGVPVALAPALQGLIAATLAGTALPERPAVPSALLRVVWRAFGPLTPR